MKKVKKCPVCGEGKKKRSCKLNQDQLICIDCCLEKQSYNCNGCVFYTDKILRFKCRSCGKTSIDDQPSEITELMGTKLFRLTELEGKKPDNGFAVSGEIYTTTLEFPFEADISTPYWFYYDPHDSYNTLQLLQGKITDVRHFDHYQAQIEMFVHQTSQCETIKNIFPEKEMPESLYDIKRLFPVGSLKIHTFGIFVLVSSMIQDGGNWIVFLNENSAPRILLYAEGWFNHWQPYAGNIKIKKSFLQQIIVADRNEN